ncbi:hypothetical protein ACLKA7_002454 [Drosophila subpalustris]
MEDNITYLLPNVLDLLSEKADLSASMDELCEHLKDVVDKDMLSAFGSLERAVEFSVELGINLGILAITEQSFLRLFRRRPDATPEQRSILRDFIIKFKNAANRL